MSRYNNIEETLECPNCKIVSKMEIFVYFGHLNCFDLKIGDRVLWEKFDSVKKGGRPSKGCLISDGWAECPNCNEELHPKILIEDDLIIGVVATASYQDVKSQLGFKSTQD